MAGIDGALVEVSAGEIRTALLTGDKLTELVIDRQSRWPAAGTLIRGRVASRHAASKAIFVDLGRGVTGFLSDKDIAGGKSLNGGQTVLVQVTRAAIDDKGPKLTGKPVVPGMHATYRPLTAGIGIAGRIKDRKLHDRLMQLGGHMLEEGEGVLWRHTAAGLDEDRLLAELAALRDMWRDATANIGSNAPAEIPLAGGSLAWTLSRHLAELETIAVEGAAEARALQDWITAIGDDLRVEPATTPVFDRYDAGGQIEAALASTVTLPSGGSVVIEQTAALTAVDVNAGRSGASALDTNREALRRIAREIRLRAIGGLIVIDFIDVPDKGARRTLDDAVRAAFAADPVRTDVLPVSRFGLVEIQRMKQGPALADLMIARATAAAGPALEAAAMDALRTAERAAPAIKSPTMSLDVPAAVADWLGRHPALTQALETRAGKPVRIRAHGDSDGAVAAAQDQA